MNRPEKTITRGIYLTTLKQLAIDLDKTNKQIGDRIEDVLRLYRLEKKWFKMNFNDSDSNTQYDFNKNSYEIMKVLLKVIDSYPLVKSEKKITDEIARIQKKNSLDVNGLQNYYQNLLDAIDEISILDLRVKIKKSAVYEKTVLEVTGVELISEKFSHFLAASNRLSEPARMRVWEKLYREIDGLIYDCYDAKVEREENFAMKYADIIQDYQESIDIVNFSQPPFAEETIKGLMREQQKALIQLEKTLQEESKYNSLDKYLAQLMLEEAYKSHYRSPDGKATIEKIITASKKDKPEEQIYAPYQINDIQKMVEDEDRDKEKAFSNEAKMIERITGCTFSELKQMELKQEEQKAKQKKEKLEKTFNEYELTKAQAQRLLQESEKKSNDYPLGELNRRLVGPKLQSIYNQLRNLHEDVSGVMYEPLTDTEQNDYQRILEVVEQSIASIDLLNEPSRVREGKMQEFYEGYVSFYNDTKQQTEFFTPKAEAFTMSTSAEALETKPPKE